jgi:hypothetical protein
VLDGVAEVDYGVEIAPCCISVGGEKVEVGDVVEVAAVAAAENAVVGTEFTPDDKTLHETGLLHGAVATADHCQHV